MKFLIFSIARILSFPATVSNVLYIAYSKRYSLFEWLKLTHTLLLVKSETMPADYHYLL